MVGPIDPMQGPQKVWDEVETTESLFPESEIESSDLILELNTKIERLQELCNRLSFSLREISQVLKVGKSSL